MAAPVYATNLVDITLAQATTGFTAIGAGGGITAETDFYIQDGTCVSKATANTWDTAGTPRGGVIFNNGAGITIPADGAVLTWIYWWGPGVLATKANGGAEIDIGSATTAYNAWYVTGGDDWEFGGWRCYPVDPAVATDRVQGTPTATLQYFGWQANVGVNQAIAKGNPYGIDAIRYGRCDVVVTDGDLANGYATFLGAANWDNDPVRRLGLLTPRDGAFYQQGLIQIGTAGTAADFRDSNRVIFIQNTEKVSAAFNRIEIRNAGTRVDWTGVNISALGTVSRGQFEMIDAADVNLDACVFTDMDSFIFQSSATVIDSTFRRCGQVTLGGATMTRCTFARTTAASALLAGSSVAELTDSAFTSDGSSHAIEITGGSEHTLEKITFSGYATTDGTTGNEAVFVNIASGSVTLNITGGTIPSIRTAGATVTVAALANVTLEGLQAGSEVRAYLGADPATATEIAGVESSGTSFAFAQSAAGQAGYIQIFALGYQPIRLLITYGSADLVIPVQQTIDRVYKNPA